MYSPQLARFSIAQQCMFNSLPFVLQEIKGILDSRASGGKTVSPEQQAIRDRLAQLRQEFDTVLVRIQVIDVTQLFVRLTSCLDQHQAGVCTRSL